MKTREAVSQEKLRGGFYSPDVLVDLCLDRSSELLHGVDDLRVLEPAAGDANARSAVAASALSRSLANLSASRSA